MHKGQAYVKGIFIFPLWRTNAPKGYLKKRIPRGKPGPEEIYYNFIKPVWTRNKTLAVTSFKISHETDKQEKQRTTEDDVIAFCDENKIIATFNKNDSSKAEDIELVNTQKEPLDNEFWSCTGSLGSANKGGICAGEDVFLCWKWSADDIGNCYYI